MKMVIGSLVTRASVMRCDNEPVLPFESFAALVLIGIPQGHGGIELCVELNSILHVSDTRGPSNPH